MYIYIIFVMLSHGGSVLRNFISNYRSLLLYKTFIFSKAYSSIFLNDTMLGVNICNCHFFKESNSQVTVSHQHIMSDIHLNYNFSNFIL